MAKSAPIQEPVPRLGCARRMLFAPRFERDLDRGGALVTVAMWALLGWATAAAVLGGALSAAPAASSTGAAAPPATAQACLVAVPC